MATSRMTMNWARQVARSIAVDPLRREVVEEVVAVTVLVWDHFHPGTREGFILVVDAPPNGNRMTRTERNALQRRAELADFLRTRRASISPADVGLPNGGRPRTPGLRREEGAT